MAGNATFESASASSCKLGFSESYLNGQRGVRSAAVAGVDKLGNIREGFEGRGFGLGISVARGGSSALVASDGSRTLSQCISLEPVVIPEQVTWCDELRRVLGVSVGSTGEEHSLRAASAHVKPVTPVGVVKDLKRFRLSARARANKMDERLRKLDKYCEGNTSKKQKMMYSINQRVEDRPKNILLNKRVRTSVAESRAKDGNILEDNGGESDLFEKMRRLAAGGEGWDKKVKRKRSVSTFVTRPVDSDEVPKRALQNKVADGHSRLSNRDDSLSNRRRPMPPSGSSPPMSQWVGQRPQKMARVRSPNLVSPVSNQDENRLSFESHSPSDVGARLTSKQSNGSPLSKKATNSPQKLMAKVENFQSPLWLSENKESVGGQKRLIGKEFGNNEMVAISKNKPLFNAATLNLFQNSRTGHKKNGSKPVRRLKKLSDRKGFSRHSPLQNNSSPDCTGASDDDRRELLAAANYARIAPHVACSSPLWKNLEPVFASISSEDKSFLSQEVGLLHQDSVSNHIQHQDKRSFSKTHDVDKISNGSIPLYQRLLSALIDEDDIDSIEKGNAKETYNRNGFVPKNRGVKSFKGSVIKNIPEDVNLEVNLFNGFSKGFSNGPQRCEEMCVDEDKLLLELQSIGIYPDTMPHLNDEENVPLQNEIDKLRAQLHQQEVKKKAYLEKISKEVELDSGSRDLQTAAMDRLVELSCRKLQANRRNPRSGIHKGPNQAALAFGKRTLARCHEFENSGISCFNEPPFHDILFAPVENDSKLLSDGTFAVNGALSNRGKKREILLNDVGTSKSRKPKPRPKPRQKTGQLPTTPGNGSTRSTHPTGPTWPTEPGSGSTRSTHPTGPTASGNGSTRSTHPTGPTWPTAYRRDVRGVSQDTNTPLNDLDPLEELDGPQDLNSFLNFDEQDPELDFAGGLDVPMDDLTELF